MGEKTPHKKILNPLEYPSKILIAWKEAIGGNKEITDVLLKSKYKELAVFCFALRNHEKSRKWLFDNQYAHLLATIEGIEGKERALVWLKRNGFELLFHFARSSDSWEDSQKWLQKKDKLFYAISLKIEFVKDEIDRLNDDPHRINP
jgi:hypothetical protein